MPLAKAGSAAPSTSGVSRRRSRPTPRQRLLDGATKLFTTEGIRVIGIDRILREADVAKASLYSLFGSKDALVIAYLKRMDEQWRQAYQERIADLKTPDEKILAFFDQVIEEEPAKQFRGSHFQNAATEFPRPETDAERGIIQAVIDHREWKLATLTIRGAVRPCSCWCSLMVVWQAGACRKALSPSSWRGTLPCSFWRPRQRITPFETGFFAAVSQ